MFFQRKTCQDCKPWANACNLRGAGLSTNLLEDLRRKRGIRPANPIHSGTSVYFEGSQSHYRVLSSSCRPVNQGFWLLFWEEIAILVEARRCMVRLLDSCLCDCGLNITKTKIYSICFLDSFLFYFNSFIFLTAKKSLHFYLFFSQE